MGAIALDPTKKYLAVGECGVSPNIALYSLPDLLLYRILRQGTTRSYASLCFNTEGTKLASVGGDPDYLLTVWDWMNERIVLKTKAFSSDVWQVSFAAHDDGQLTTSGAGHIRFWKMASTFTGLKLQGDIGMWCELDASTHHIQASLAELSFLTSRATLNFQTARSCRGRSGVTCCCGKVV